MPNCSFLVHYGFEINESGSDKKQNDKINKLIKDLMSEKTGMSTRTINKWLSGETYFDPHKAKRYGLVDEIVGETK